MMAIFDAVLECCFIPTIHKNITVVAMAMSQLLIKLKYMKGKFESAKICFTCIRVWVYISFFISVLGVQFRYQIVSCFIFHKLFNFLSLFIA